MELRKLGANANVKQLISQKIKNKFEKKQDIKVHEDEDAFNTFLQLKNNIDSNEDYFDVFEDLFSKKLKECIQKEENRVLNKDQLERQMFEFSKRRLAEIEALVVGLYQEEKKIQQHRVTKMDNEAFSGNQAEMQREMMRGNYQFNLNSSLPFGHNIVKLANEPVAFQLYKYRHFEKVKNKKVAS